MTLLITLIVIVGMLVLVLAVILAVQFVRLSRELRRVSDDAGSMVDALRRNIRTVQLAVPVAIALRGKLGAVYKRARAQLTKGVSHDREKTKG